MIFSAKTRRWIQVGLVVLVLVAPVMTYAADWWPIVPCGLQSQPAGVTLQDPGGGIHDYTQPCNQCLLILLFKNLIDMVQFWIVPTLGTLFFIIGGFLILVGGGGGNTKLVGMGRTTMKNAAIGIAIVLGSWLITNSILKSISGNDPTAAAAPWYQIQCSSGSLQNAVDASIPHVGNGAPQPGGPGGIAGGSACMFSGINLCQGTTQTPFSSQTMQCNASGCNTYSAAIGSNANKFGVSANLLKAIMVKESSCNAAAHSASSYGLMELQPATAIQMSQYCGVSGGAIDGQWLIDHPTESICLAAAYLKSVAAGSCGSSPRNIAAGYNAGPGYCAASTDCAGQSSCSNEAIKKWECNYEDPQHQTCNTRLNETKDYAVKVLYCMNNPGF